MLDTVGCPTPTAKRAAPPTQHMGCVQRLFDGADVWWNPGQEKATGCRPECIALYSQYFLEVLAFIGVTPFKLHSARLFIEPPTSNRCHTRLYRAHTRLRPLHPRSLRRCAHPLKRRIRKRQLFVCLTLLLIRSLKPPILPRCLAVAAARRPRPAVRAAAQPVNIRSGHRRRTAEPVLAWDDAVSAIILGPSRGAT